MKELISDQPILMDSKPEIEQLDEKQIRVRYSDGDEGDRSIWVQKGGPHGRETGKCAVVLCHPVFKPGSEEELECGEPETVHFAEEYLSPEAIKLIRDDEDFPNKLFLDLT